MYRTSDDQLNLRDFFSNSCQERSIKCCSWRGSWQMACQIVLSRNAPSGWHLAPHSLSQSVQYRCTAWVNFHQPQYRFTERYQFPLATYQLSFHPTLHTAKISSTSSFLFAFTLLWFSAHTHTHFLLTTRYLTVTEGKFHLIPFHIIRHLLGSHCHVMTISEGREQTLFCSSL